MSTARQLSVAALVGVVIALVCLLLAEIFVPELQRSKVEFKDLPPAAQAMLRERGDSPMTSEQWKQLDQVMAQNVGWPSGQSVFLALVRSTWYMFIVLPVLLAWLLAAKWRIFTNVQALVACFPSLALLIVALVRPAT